MFSIMDSGAVVVEGGKMGAKRTCDQCKLRKVKCDMIQPCQQCTTKAFNCTYDRVRKKRGPAGKRIESILRQQSSIRTPTSGNGEPTPPASSAEMDLNGYELQQTMSATSSDPAILERTPTNSQASYSPLDGSSVDPSLSLQSPHLSNPTSIPDPNIVNTNIANPDLSDFVLPSLPMESPSGSPGDFANIWSLLNEDLSIPEERWPRTVNEETLLPWIDVYFKRLHPTIPVLNRTTMYEEMLSRRNHTHYEFGAMLLSLCAFAMTQPVQIHEVAESPSRTAQARMLMEESVKMRITADFGEQPIIETVLTSFFLFACLFGDSKRGAASHRLREAVDLAQTMGIDQQSSYESLDSMTREKWLRTYLVLSVTERAYALQQRRPIGFRGQIGFNARFKPASPSSNGLDVAGSFQHLLSHEPSDMHAITGLLFLAETFNAFDESIIECWNGHCRFSDGLCEAFDRRRALQMFQAQQRAREVCLGGNIQNLQSSQRLTLSELTASQQADISVTHFWLLNRLWSLCLAHGLLRGSSAHPELRYEFACHIAKDLWISCRVLPFSAMEVHGVGLAEKIYHVCLGVLTALRLDEALNMRTDLTHFAADATAGDTIMGDDNLVLDVQTLLQSFSTLLDSFRGGLHNYGMLLQAALGATEG